VQDLREVCKTSAADRAAAQRSSPDVRPASPRSAIQLPASGPLVIPGKLVSMTLRDSGSPEKTLPKVPTTALSSDHQATSTS